MKKLLDGDLWIVDLGEKALFQTQSLSIAGVIAGVLVAKTQSLSVAGVLVAKTQSLLIAGVLLALEFSLALSFPSDQHHQLAFFCQKY